MEFSQVKMKMQASGQVFVGKAICHFGETQVKENGKEDMALVSTGK